MYMKIVVSIVCMFIYVQDFMIHHVKSVYEDCCEYYNKTIGDIGEKKFWDKMHVIDCK